MNSWYHNNKAKVTNLYQGQWPGCLSWASKNQNLLLFIGFWVNEVLGLTWCCCNKYEGLESYEQALFLKKMILRALDLGGNHLKVHPTYSDNNLGSKSTFWLLPSERLQKMGDQAAAKPQSKINSWTFLPSHIMSSSREKAWTRRWYCCEIKGGKPGGNEPLEQLVPSQPIVAT